MRGSWEPRRGRSRPRVIIGLVVGCLVAAACGGGGDDGASDEVALEEIEAIVDVDPCELLDAEDAARLSGAEVDAATSSTDADGTTRCEFAFADAADADAAGLSIAASLTIGPGDEGDVPTGSALARSLSLGEASGVEEDDGAVRVVYLVREVVVRVEVAPGDGVVDDELIEKVVAFTETTEAPVTEAVTGEPFVDDDPPQTTTTEPADEPEGQTVEPDGPPVTLSVEESGDSDSAFFDADAGDVYFIDILSLSFDAAGTTDCVGLSVLNEDGVTLTGTGTACTDAVFIDRVLIDQPGTYEVLLDPNGPVTGTIEFALETVEDEEQTTTIGGGAVTMTVSGRGGVARLEFEGQPGQAIRVPVPSATRNGPENQCLLVRLEEPGGFSRNFTCALEDGTAFIDRVELTRPGTHAIIFDPDGEMTGSVQVSVEAA